MNQPLDGLPGAELIVPGLADLAAGRITIESLLAAIVSNRLRQYGLLDMAAEDLPAEAEITLYTLLCGQPGDAYSRYSAFLERLSSFESALDRRFSPAN